MCGALIKSCRRYSEEVWSYILPHRCVVCGRDTSFCFRTMAASCYKSVVSLREKEEERESNLNICSQCLTEFVPLNSDERWNFCLSNPLPNDQFPNLALYIAFNYEGIMRRVVTNMKFRGRYQCGFWIGILLGSLLKNDGVKVDAIVPMPLHSKRLKERGYNQAELIAYAVSVILGVPMLSDVLRRVKYTERQTEIQGNDLRIKNVSQAFKVSKDWDVNGCTILLVDDVVTTGFTFHEAASALQNNGAKVLCCAAAGNRLLKNSERF